MGAGNARLAALDIANKAKGTVATSGTGRRVQALHSWGGKTQDQALRCNISTDFLFSVNEYFNLRFSLT